MSYLNTVPLVWGMLHGSERDAADVRFSIPSICAEELENGLIEAGIVPVAEVARQGLRIVSDVGIACRGAVRSILLISRKPFKDVKTLAADLSSRTSVQLAKVILRERYGAEPAIHRAAPDLDSMLTSADAALIIGDPALLIEPSQLPYDWLDLGEEWLQLTNLPMVFAAWAGKPGIDGARIAKLTRSSYEFGREHLDEIIAAEYEKRGLTRALASAYLRDYIRFELGKKETEGLQTFFELAQMTQAIPV